MNVCVIKQNYVIDILNFENGIIDGWQYDREHDLIIEDPTETVGIGDWYEEPEGIFYRPVNSRPSDLPQILLY